MMLCEVAYAKINLALHIRRKREDGYHDIETLFAFCEDGDVLRGEAADEISLMIDGPFAEGLVADEGNLVIRATRALQAAAGVTTGARLHLTKNLPIASGIGGGSADAAAALRLLARLWKVDTDLHSIAADLGADVPACLLSQTTRGEGVGEALTPLGDSLKTSPVLLVNPRVGVSTDTIFKAWDGVDRGALAHSDDMLALAQSSRNDLTVPAIALVPVITDLLAALEQQPGTTLTRMSGSGATGFALYSSIQARDFAHAAIVATHPEWWTLASRLR